MDHCITGRRKTCSKSWHHEQICPVWWRTNGNPTDTAKFMGFLLFRSSSVDGLRSYEQVGVLHILICHHPDQSQSIHVYLLPSQHDCSFFVFLDPPECKLTRAGEEYVWKRNTTISGYCCRHWLTLSSNENAVESFDVIGIFRWSWCESQLLSQQGMPTSTVHIATLHCGPYCYSLSGTKRVWEHCNVPICTKSDEEQCDIRISGICVCEYFCRPLRIWSIMKPFAGFGSAML